MKALSLTAGVLAAALAATSVSAADLDYGYVPPPDRYGSAYEDPRYRDLYGPETRPSYGYAPRVYDPRYGDRVEGPVPPGYVYRDRYAGAGPDRQRGYVEGCLSRHDIKRRLASDGWQGFHDIELRGDVARVSARRYNGDLFSLKVDRCTGDVLKAELLERGSIGPYADRRGPVYYDRRYY